MGGCSLNERDNNLDIGERNNREVVSNEDNYNSDSQTHDNEEEIGRLDDSTFENIYDPSQWKNIDTTLRDLLVEKGPIKVTDMDFPKDKCSRHKLANKGSKDWRNLSAKLKIVKTLSKINLAFCGKNEKIYQEANGNFLTLIEIIAEFDPIMQEHILQIKDMKFTTITLGIIYKMTKSKQKLLKIIKDTKYYAIILDCTPDISHQEKMSFVLRCVDIASTPIQMIQVEKMSFYTPCGCHSLNLVFCDMANSCPKATSFFGVLQRVYTLFSSSTKRWKISQNHIHSLTLKSLSQTHWESRIESVKAVRFQTLQIRDALFELVEASDDPKLKSEVDCLENYELENFEFLLGMTIWYDILFAVNLYRENGFENALISTKEIAFEMDIEPKFHEKRISRRKKQFDENVKDEIVKSLQESFRIDYLFYIVDKAITTLQSIFEQFKIYEDIFYFLFRVKKLKLLDCTLLKEKCLNLEKSLKHDNLLDVDGLDLFSELNILKEIIGLENDKPIDILNYIKRINYFQNAYIAYRIMLTIPVSVASTEKSFSKLKIIKTYLRSTMSQQRLNGLALLSIEKEILNEINYNNLIDNFASQKAEKINFK
ncbi:Zinc finger MYM-type protein 1 [Glycine soja]